MKIVSILGGLGSQMTKYGIFYAMKNKSSDDCRIDASYYSCNNCWNGYELGRLFGISAEQMDCTDLQNKGQNDYLYDGLQELCINGDTIYYRMGYPIFLKKDTNIRSPFIRNKLVITRKVNSLFRLMHPREKFDKSIYESKYNLFIDECFINSDYPFSEFRKELTGVFSFHPVLDDHNLAISHQMLRMESIAIHVRRTDHLGDNGKLYENNYYEKALSYIRVKTEGKCLLLCVFSDDIEWCVQNKGALGIKEDDEVLYIDWNKGQDSYKDMQLMTYCKHNILAISSFSWWGYYLSLREDKIVCAPEGYWTEITNHF